MGSIRRRAPLIVITMASLASAAFADTLMTHKPGTYKIEVALDPPLVLDNVTIEKDKTSTVEVIKEKKAFRMEASQ